MFSKARLIFAATIILLGGHAFFTPTSKVAAQAGCDAVAADGLDHSGNDGQCGNNDGQNGNVDDQGIADINDGEQGQNGDQGQTAVDDGQNGNGEQGQNGDQGKSDAQAGQQGNQGNSQ
ncbi:MAG: hypothetical protein ACYDBJ_21835 [Aggregatilineales bacterium]